MRFGKSYWYNYDRAVEKEWIIGNGRSGFCGSTIIGANTRKYHGLLIGTLSSPDERYMVLSKLQDKLIINNKEFLLSTTKYEDEISKGYINQQSFVYDGIPQYRYVVDNIIVDKSIVMEYKKNTVVIKYCIRNGDKNITLSIDPWMCFRKPGDCNEKNTLSFNKYKTQNGFKLKPKLKDDVDINIFINDKVVCENNEYITKNVFYDVDISTGDEYLEKFYVPGTMKVNIEANEVKTIYVVCTMEKDLNIDGNNIFKSERSRIDKLINTFDDERLLAKYLPLAADTFIVDRDSINSTTILAGYPWFLDWGRDTMISIIGLTMVTNRLSDAKAIIKSFSIYEKDGLIPNMFPHNGQEPIYNTADASLWFINAVYYYLKYSNNKKEEEFIKDEIFETIKRIIKGYKNGTKFNIKMQEDGLISAGSGLDQVTWMDVRFDNIVVTPRHGKPVEINALWYNALKIAEILDKKFGGTDYKEYALIADKVKKSFNNKFWNEEKQCLYDVINNKVKDDSIRPNQIFAVSLPFTMLSEEKESFVVKKVFKELYTPYGLRSLDRENKDYKGTYKGKLRERDMAYHQGTVWAFPLGAFLSAYCKVNNNSKESVEFVDSLLKDMETHLQDQCLGTISEIFDGNSPYFPRGCYSQAWSVGEMLRVYYECIESNKIINK